MANAKEILARIHSIEDTKKITTAMYMISSTKLKRSKKMLEETEPYFFNLQTLIRRILRHMPETSHEFFNPRHDIPESERKHGLIIVTGDKGLAGAYNHNVLKQAEAWIKEDPNHRLYVVGEVGRHYFAARHIPVEEQFHYTVQNPTMHRARLIALSVLEDYRGGRLDDVSILFTEMVNSLQEETEIQRLLPLKREDFHDIKIPVDIMQECFELLPSPKEVLDNVIPNYITGFIFGALVEAFCSEQNARMLAMKSASDNAEKLLAELRIQYNRVRQAAITQEITEVISGAKALKKKR